MTLRELITWVGFDVDTADLSRYDAAVGRVMNSSTGLYNNLMRMADGITQVGKKMTLGLSLPIAGVATAGVLATSKVEKFQTSFEVMLKSADKAEGLMKELFQFEAVTPFNLEQVMNATNKLLIAKEPVKNITKQLMMLGNVAAGDAQRLQSIVYVLGQVRSLGYLQGQDIMQFTNALVPIRDAISKVTGVEGKALQKMIEQRKITADMTQKALELIARERSGLMEKQALTLRGLWSSLMSAVFRIRAAVGDMIVSTLHLDVILKRVIKWMNDFTKFIENLDPTIKKIIVWVGVVIFTLGPLLTVFGIALKSLLLIKAALVGLGLAGVKLTLAGIIPLLGKAAVAIGAIALKLALVSAAAIGVFLVAEDIIGYFTGKDSLIIPALLKLGDFLEKKMAEWNNMTLEEWRKTLMFFVQDWEQTFDKIYKFFENLIKGMKELILKEGLLELLKPSWLFPMGGIPGKMAEKATGGAIGNWWERLTGDYAAYRGGGGKLGDIKIDFGGIHFDMPPGTTSEQGDYVRKEMERIIKIDVIENIKKHIVTDIESGTRG